MKRKNLMILCGAAAASVLAISATAMAAPGAAVSGDVPPADGEVTETVVEIDTETGIVTRDGEAVGNIASMASEDVCYVVTMEGENGELTVIDPATGELLPYTAADAAQSVTPEAAGMTTAEVTYDDESGNILQDGKVIGHAEKGEDGEISITLEGVGGEPIVVTPKDSASDVAYTITDASSDANGNYATFTWTDAK